MTLLPNVENALVWCADIPDPATAPATDAKSRALHPLAVATPAAQFSELLNVIYDRLLKHPDAYRAVQAAVRVWRDGPEAWPEYAREG